MMKLRTDLPIKYYLNVYNEEALQDDLVILFNISQYLLKVIELKGKSLDLENLKFTTASFKYIFGDRIKEEIFKSSLIKRIKTLIQEEYIAVKKEQFYITTKGAKEKNDHRNQYRRSNSSRNHRNSADNVGPGQ